MNTGVSEHLQRQQMMALLNHQSHQNQHVPEDPRSQPSPGYFTLDPSSAAKQMAALNAAAQSRRISQSGGTSDTLFGSRHPVHDSTPDTSTSAQINKAPAASPQVLKSRRDEFLKFVAGVMNARHTPLPATITGIPSAYDPNTSRWKTIEPTAEPGGFRLAGKDVDLFRLWQVVLSLGGNAKLTRDSGWSLVLSHFGLPEEIPDAQSNGTTSVARILAHYYMALLAPFEEVYLRNMQQQQQKAIQARNQQLQQQGHVVPSIQDPSPTASSSHHPRSPVYGFPLSTSIPPPTQLSSFSSSVETERHPMSPHTLDTALLGQHRPSTASMSHSSSPTPQGSDFLQGIVGSEPRDRSELMASPVQPQSSPMTDHDSESRKRKFIEEEAEKRARQRTDSSIMSQDTETAQDVHPSHQAQSPQLSSQGQLPSPARPSTSNAPQTSSQARARRKIEYVPLAREIDTFGGRDLDMIDAEFGKVASRRSQRSIDEWGTVDIDGLTMSLRSRIPTEISYALTALTILSTMRGQSPDTGFSLHQCDDLFDELLDLLREQAFGEKEDVILDHPESFWTHRELITAIHDHGLQTFSNVPCIGSQMTANGGLHPPAANAVFAILNLFRNFSLTSENQRFMAQQPATLPLILRVCSLSVPPKVTKGCLPSPSSPVLSLVEVVKARRDVLTIVSNLVPFANLSSYPFHICARLFELLASFLVEPHELISPSGIFIQGGSNAAGVRPPLVVDLALEAFSKLAQPDANRFAFSRGIKLPWLWALFTSLVHRLPISTEDFTITMRMHDVWLSYVEKVVLSIYSICFLATPELKAKIRSDRSLAFPKLIVRMVKRFVNITHPDARQYFLVSSRRAVEALKLIDDGGDAFDSPQTTAPQLAFGMGFGDTDAKQTEVGIGLLAGYQEDVTWNIMMMPHLDDVMFSELDSLSRTGV